MLSEELEKGAEINPALIVPEQVTSLFPDMSKLQTIEYRIKAIPEKTSP